MWFLVEYGLYTSNCGPCICMKSEAHYTLKYSLLSVLRIDKGYPRDAVHSAIYIHNYDYYYGILYIFGKPILS